MCVWGGGGEGGREGVHPFLLRACMQSSISFNCIYKADVQSSCCIDPYMGKNSCNSFKNSNSDYRFVRPTTPFKIFNAIYL